MKHPGGICSTRASYTAPRLDLWHIQQQGLICRTHTQHRGCIYSTRAIYIIRAAYATAWLQIQHEDIYSARPVFTARVANTAPRLHIQHPGHFSPTPNPSTPWGTLPNRCCPQRQRSRVIVGVIVLILKKNNIYYFKCNNDPNSDLAPLALGSTSVWHNTP